MTKKYRSFLSMIISVFLCFSGLGFPLTAEEKTEQPEEIQEITAEEVPEETETSEPEEETIPADEEAQVTEEEESEAPEEAVEQEEKEKPEETEVTETEEAEEVLTEELTEEEEAEVQDDEPAVITEDKFEDPQLYQYLLREYGVGDQLTQEKLDTVTNAYFSFRNVKKGLTSIEGIQYLRNLTYLDISGHNLTDISPVLGLTNLQTLNANYNDLASIPDLSGMQNLKTLQLQYNFLTEDTLTADKLPPQVAANTYYISSALNMQRKPGITTESQYYFIDGKATFLLGCQWKTNRDVYAELTYGEKTATVKSDDYLTMYTKQFRFDDLNSAEYDFGLEPENDYNFSLRVYDSYGTQMEKNITVHYTDKIVLMNTEELADSETYYRFIFQILGSYAMEDISILLQDQEGKVFESIGEISASVQNYGGYYPDLYYDNYNISNTQTTMVGFTTFRGIPAGEYDVVVTVGEKTYVLAKKIISYAVSEGPLVNYTDLVDEYDNYGPYVHIQMEMSNMYSEDIIPILYVGEEAVTEPEPVNVITVDDYLVGGKVIFVLKKTGSVWNNTDSTIEGKIRLLNPKNIAYRDLRDMHAEGLVSDYDSFWLYPNYTITSGAYNYKKDRFEFSTSSNFPAGTEVRINLKQLFGSAVIAQGTGTVDENHMLYMVLKDPEGNVYEPVENTVQLYLTASFTVNGSNRTANCSLDLQKYNFEETDVSFSTREAIYTDRTSLDVWLELSDPTADPDDYTIDIQNLNTGTVYNVTTVWHKVSETAYLGIVDLQEPLSADVHTVRLKCPDGKVKGFQMTVVEDDGGFWLESQDLVKTPDDPDNDYVFTVSSVTLSQYNNDEIADLFENDGVYAIHFFDKDWNELTGWTVTANEMRAATNDWKFYIKGLSTSLDKVYARITKDGLNGGHTPTGLLFYEHLGEEADPEHGVLYTFPADDGSGFYVSLVSDSQAFNYGLLIRGTAGYPVTLEVYPYGQSVPVKTITVSSATELEEDNYYYFTAEDLEGLSVDTLYRFVIRADGNHEHYTDAGYIGAVNQGPVSVKSVSLSETELTLNVGEKHTLTATVLPANAENKAVSWTSSDESVVSVSDGTVTALNEGTAVITVTTEDGNKTASCTVTVTTIHLESIAIAEAESTVFVGKKLDLDVVFVPENPTNKNVTWSSGDETIAAVDENGVVKGLKTGTTVITVTAEDGGLTASKEITVVQPVKKIVLNYTDEIMVIDDELPLEAEVFPENASNQNIIWTSDNEEVASVDEDGWVTSLAEGTAVITASSEDGNASASCVITVFPAGMMPGIFVKGLEPSYSYTGTAVKPEIEVYDSPFLSEFAKLTPGTDYTVTYKNNTKAYHIDNPENLTATDKKKAPQMTIKAKGNYKGSVTVCFSIDPLDINDERITADELSAQAGTKPIKPVPTVYFNGKKLKVNTDYTVDYNGWDQLTPGDHTILIKGKENSNFTGTREVVVHVAPVTMKSVAKLTVLTKALKYADLTEENFEEKVKTAITVKNGKTKLSVDEDYFIEGITEDKIAVGTFTVTLKGNEVDYDGARTVSVKITGIALSDKKMKAKTGLSYPYTGEEIEIDPETSLLTYNKVPLAEGEDYEITGYTKNLNAGTASVTVKGINNYTGTKKVNFKITPMTDPVDDSRITIAEAFYSKGGSKPEVTIEGMTVNTDYTLKYTKNTKANTKGTVTITFKGNYKGTPSKVLTFDIRPKDIREVTITAKDKECSTKANAWKSAPVLKDTNGKTLKAGTDYKVTKYTNKEGEELTGAVPAGTTVIVTVEGLGGYAGTTTSVTYKILETGKDISKMTFKIANKEYIGAPVYVNDDDIMIKLGKKNLDPTTVDYIVTGYSNNVNKGTAKVTFQGVGEYGGTKTVSFKIVQRNITDNWNGVRCFLENLF